MGRHSNLVLVDEDDRILEAARHVNQDMSRVRQLQPGITYEPPPAQDKLAPEELTADALTVKLTALGDLPLAKALSQSISGLSMQAARELAFRVLTPGSDRPENVEDASRRLTDLLHRLPGMAEARVLLSPDGDAADVLAFPYLSMSLADQQVCPSLSEALEKYFGDRDAKDRISQKSASMVRLLKGQVERCEKKLALQEEELASAARMEEYRIMGELINANLWQLKKGMKEAELQNFYDENGGMLTVPMDIQLTPQQNAQRYFKKYQKARSARQTASEQREKTIQELNYL